MDRETIENGDPLAEVWERHAADWIAWARIPGHDSYWRFHRDACGRRPRGGPRDRGAPRRRSPATAARRMRRPGGHVDRDGLRVTFESEHRPLAWYVDALADAGLLVERLREVRIPDADVSKPRQRRWQRIPLFLHMRAVRP